MSTTLKYRHGIIFLVSVSALFSAYIAEYIFGFLPCPLCVYQRIPYTALALIAVIGFASNSNLTITYIFTLILGIMLSSYHVAIEQGFIEPSAICHQLVAQYSDMSIQEMHLFLDNVRLPSCNVPSIKIFALSMTEWSLIIQIFLVFVTLILRSNNNSTEGSYRA